MTTTSSNVFSTTITGNPLPYLSIVPELYTYGADMDTGRGSHSVIKVTNLNDSGTGSFRAAVTASGARVVIFEVGGVCNLSSDIYVDNDNMIIAGQTAPSPGFFYYGQGLKIRASNILVQHISGGYGPTPNSPTDGNEDTLRISGNNDYIVIDHCSFYWGLDENVSAWGSGTTDIPDYVSFSNCLIAEALHRPPGTTDTDGKGMLVGTNTGNTNDIPNFACINNLFVCNWMRNPQTNDAYVANNYIYYWRYQGAQFRGQTEGTGVGHSAIVGNYWSYGDFTSGDNGANTSRKPILMTNFASGSSVYLDGNDSSFYSGGTTISDNWDNLVIHEAGSSEANARNDTQLPQYPPIGFTPIPVSQVKSARIATAGARPGDRDIVATRLVGYALADVGGSPFVDDSTSPSIGSGSTSHTVPGSYNTINPSGYSVLEEWLHTFYAGVE